MTLAYTSSRLIVEQGIAASPSAIAQHPNTPDSFDYLRDWIGKNFSVAGKDNVEVQYQVEGCSTLMNKGTIYMLRELGSGSLKDCSEKELDKIHDFQKSKVC